MRMAYRIYKFKRKELDLSKIFYSYKSLTTEHTIDQYMINRLLKALKHEKKRRRRGKRLNLLKKKDSRPQFFSPAKIQTTKDFQALKKENKIIRQQNLKEKKVLQTAKKKQKKEEKMQKAAATTKRRRIAAEVKEVKVVKKQAQLKPKQAAKRDKEK